MYQAYHMIGLSHGDTGRLSAQHDHPEVVAAIVERVHQKYLAICAAGHLRPAQDDEQSRQFAADHLVGDDQYVFLSAGKRYWNEEASVNFGFIFDAEVLIDSGAMVRAYDLMGDYDDLLGEVAADFSDWRDPSEWSAEEKVTLFAHLDNPGSTDETYSAPNDGYYRLLDAIQAQDESVPFASEAIAAFRQRAIALQATIQYTGEAAKQYLREHGADGSAELLVKGQLPISQSIAVIEFGKEKLRR